MKRHLIALGSALTLLTAPAVAATYPDKPVKIVVAFAPGSGTDNIARYYATRLSQAYDQSFVVENRPGANGSIAAARVAKSPADGYTLLLGSNSTLSAAPFLLKSLPYDPIADFAPIARLSDIPSVLAVAQDSPIQTFQDFLAQARANPGKLTWGNANTAHLAAGMALATNAKLDILSVMYKSSAQALVDLMGGQISSMVVDTSASFNFLQQGKIRALAVTTAKPVDSLPGIPPMSATVPGIDVYSWLGIVAPSGTPDAIVQSLNETLLKINAQDDTRQFLKNNAAAEPPPASSPAEFAAFVRTQLDVWKQLLHNANVTPQ